VEKLTILITTDLTPASIRLLDSDSDTSVRFCEPSPVALRAALPAARVELRDYQEACLRAILAAYQRGVRRQLVCLPTGTGKTVIFSEFPRFFQMQKRMLVLAHRAELLDQARDKIRRTAPHLRVAIDQGARRAEDACDVVVASVPTLGRAGSARLQRLNPEEFYLVIVDEAHHATAETYRRVLEHFDVFAPGTKRLVVGFTATPRRGDGQGLHQVFEEIVYSRSLPEMIEAGHLAPVAGYRVETAIDLTRVKSRMGDFVTGELAASVNVGERNALVVDVFRKHLAPRKTICFCVDVAHAQCLSEAFLEADIPAAAIHGGMSAELRHGILEAFRQGDLQVLANCMVLTEGYDEPSIEGIILARPTRSALLYTQMIGRGTRLHPGKEDVKVIDIVDVTREHALVTLPSLFGLSDTFDLGGRTTTEAREAIAWVESHRPWVNLDRATSLEDLRYRCTRIDLLDLETPEELLGCARFAWGRVGRAQIRLGLGPGAALLVAPTILDEWEVSLREGAAETRLHAAGSQEAAVHWAETYVEQQHPDVLRLVERHTRWRREPASDKQAAILKARRLHVPVGLTKGQASHLIGMLQERPG